MALALPWPRLTVCKNKTVCKNRDLPHALSADFRNRTRGLRAVANRDLLRLFAGRKTAMPNALLGSGVNRKTLHHDEAIAVKARELGDSRDCESPSANLI